VKSSKSKPKRKCGESTTTIGLTRTDLYFSENPFKSDDAKANVVASDHDLKGTNDIASDSGAVET
jgi:hypothetical protein